MKADNQGLSRGPGYVGHKKLVPGACKGRHVDDTTGLTLTARLLLLEPLRRGPSTFSDDDLLGLRTDLSQFISA